MIALFNFRKLKVWTLVLALAMPIALMAEVSPDAGKTLFKNYCAQCHAKNMKSALTGPALGGAEERWDTQENLYAWIRNSQGMIASGHPRAVELWNQYKPTVMTSYPDLTDDEIGSILAYINGVYDGTYGAAPKTGGGGAEVTVKKKDNTWMYIGIAGALGLLALLLTRIIGNLNSIAAAKEGVDYEQKSIWQILTSKGVLSVVMFLAVVLAGYFTVNNAIGLGRQQDYAPDQPIKFSHATHAGEHKIECQYCHDGARRSKHSVIPAANTCMNCHRAIKVGSQYGTAELTKIYASIGYDPSTNKYIEDYESKSEDEIKAIYTKWMADTYINENDVTELGIDGERLVKDQWAGLVSSLTNDQKKQIQGPIEWTRIHNLPDHAYFNHAQHVSVGKVECQTCHGEVEKMEVVAQHSTLSMGWCINCHRESKVKFTDNEYYTSYEKYHKEMASGEREFVSVSDIGGLECQKCHY